MKTAPYHRAKSRRFLRRARDATGPAPADCYRTR